MGFALPLLTKRHIRSSSSSCFSSSQLRISTATSPYTRTLFEFHLDDGHCIGVELDATTEDDALEGWSDPSHWVHTCLHPDEVQYAINRTRPIRKSFLLGRLAMRSSLRRYEYINNNNHHDGNNNNDNNYYFDPTDHSTTPPVVFPSIPPCLKDAHGRPTLPPTHLGSISHKLNVGVALTAPSAPLTCIGVDIERNTPNKRSIATKILTKREIEELGQLEDITAEEEVMLRFSLKEAIYKAIHPLLNQYVGFQEAEVTPLQDGTAVVQWYLTTGAHTKLDRVEAHWLKMNDYFLTTSTCSLKQAG